MEKRLKLEAYKSLYNVISTFAYLWRNTLYHCVYASIHLAIQKIMRVALSQDQCGSLPLPGGRATPNFVGVIAFWAWLVSSPSQLAPDTTEA